MKVLKACLASLWFWINVSAGVHILTFVFLSQYEGRDFDLFVKEGPNYLEAALVPLPPREQNPPPPETIVESPKIEPLGSVHSVDGPPIEIREEENPKEQTQEPMEEKVIADPISAVEQQPIHEPLEEASEEALEEPAPATPSVEGAATFQPPTPLANPAPNYPAMALKLGHEGTVRLSAKIGADGRAKTVEVINSSGHRELDASAMETVSSKWRFRPATRDGMPQVTSYSIDIRFSLQ